MPNFRFSCLACNKPFDKLTADNKCPFCQSDQITANVLHEENEVVPAKDSEIENLFVSVVVKILKNLNEFYHADKFLIHSFIVFLILAGSIQKFFYLDARYALGFTLLFIIMRKKG